MMRKTTRSPWFHLPPLELDSRAGWEDISMVVKGLLGFGRVCDDVRLCYVLDGEMNSDGEVI